MGRVKETPVEGQASAPDLVSDIARFRNDPLGFVLYAFHWGEGDLKDETGPDRWQAEYLDDLGKAYERQEADGGAVIRMAVASGNGAGKSALVSWILIHWLSTRFEPQTVVTANTAVQLETKTWRELSIWQRRAINGSWFQHTATTFYLKERKTTHFAAAIPWSPQRAEAFAGTHAENVLIVMDEASGIDDIIWETAEGAFTTPGCVFLVFGNPTRNDGRFRECWRRFAKRWLTKQVDTRTCKKANQEQIREWIEDYGIDSDFVRVRVFGLFPRAASMQFISGEDVEAAQKRTEIFVGNYPTWMDFPLVVGVDVARFGDDRTVLIARQGPKLHEIRKFEGLDTVQVTFQVIALMNELKKRLAIEVESVFVDAGGLGAGVADQLRAQEVPAYDVQFGESAFDKVKFFNRTAEMWWEMRDWIKTVGILPDAQTTDGKEMFTDLTGRQYGYAKDMIVQLEKKTDMKKRGLASPDLADALCLTFAWPVVNQRQENAVTRRLAELVSGQADAGASHMAY